MKKYTDLQEEYLFNSIFNNENIDEGKIWNKIKNVSSNFLKWLFKSKQNNTKQEYNDPFDTYDNIIYNSNIENKYDIDKNIKVRHIKYYSELNDIIEPANTIEGTGFSDFKRYLSLHPEFKKVNTLYTYIAIEIDDKVFGLVCLSDKHWNDKSDYKGYFHIYLLETIENISPIIIIETLCDYLSRKPRAFGITVDINPIDNIMTEAYKKCGFKHEVKSTGTLYSYKFFQKKIHENLTDNFLWKLDKWFERNDEQKKEFIELIIYCKQNSTDVKNIENFIKNTSLYKNLKEFINFLNDDFDFETNKDYIYQLKKIIEIAISNKSERNNYNNSI